MEDIYDIQKRLESVRQKISGSSMIESNKEKILEFANCCLANGVGKNKTSRYLYDLHNLSIWLNKPFEEATKKDMEAIMVRLQALFNEGLIQIIDHRDLTKHLLAMKWELSSTMKKKVVDPEDYSPDWADALVYLTWKEPELAFGFI